MDIVRVNEIDDGHRKGEGDMMDIVKEMTYIVRVMGIS